MNSEMPQLNKSSAIFINVHLREDTKYFVTQCADYNHSHIHEYQAVILLLLHVIILILIYFNIKKSLNDIFNILIQASAL